MKVELTDHTVDPVQKVGRAALICYDSDDTPEKNAARARHCKDKGHLATMRFAYATFQVSDISRICSHQIVRMAHAGLLQESQRYVSQSNCRFINPPSLETMPEHIRIRWESLQSQSVALYIDSVDAGMKKEDARYALLHSASTRLNMCLNFQAWQDFLRNRTAKSAQWEVRDVAVEIQRQLHELAPELF